MHYKHTHNFIIMSTTIETLTQRVEVLEKQIALLLKNNQEPEIPKKTKKSKKNNASDSEDEKPKKKRVSGYILFSNASRDEVRDSLTTDDEKPKNTDIMKQLAKMWKELSDDEKEVWNNKAKEDKD